MCRTTAKQGIGYGELRDRLLEGTMRLQCAVGAGTPRRCENPHSLEGDVRCRQHRLATARVTPEELAVVAEERRAGVEGHYTVCAWCGKRYLTEDTKIVEVAGKRRIVCPKCARKLDKGEAEREKRAPF